MRNSERVLPAVSPTVLAPAGPECNIASSAVAELLRRLAVRSARQGSHPRLRRGYPAVSRSESSMGSR